MIPTSLPAQTSSDSAHVTIPTYLEGIVTEGIRRSGEASYYKLPGELVLLVMASVGKVYRFIIQSERNSRVVFVEAKFISKPTPHIEFEYRMEQYAPDWLFRQQADAMAHMANILEAYAKEKKK